MSREGVESVKEGRKRLESGLRGFFGNIFVPEAKVFVMRCGCLGFYADIRGLRYAEISAWRGKVRGILEGISEDLGLRAEFLYARRLPGSEEVVALTARQLCERCKREVASSIKRPDVVVLKMLKR